MNTDRTKDLLVAAARLRYAPETAQKAVLLHHRLRGAEPARAVAAASLFLAGKADEQPRRVRDVLNAVAPRAGAGASLDGAYHDAKADLVDAEQACLRELGFDASAETPLALALALCHALELAPATSQLALCLANDALWAAAGRAARPAALAAAAVDVAPEATGDAGASGVAVGWARRFGAADADVRAARDAILDVIEAAAERRRTASAYLPDTLAWPVADE